MRWTNRSQAWLCELLAAVQVLADSMDAALHPEDRHRTRWLARCAVAGIDITVASAFIDTCREISTWVHYTMRDRDRFMTAFLQGDQRSMMDLLGRPIDRDRSQGETFHQAALRTVQRNLDNLNTYAIRKEPTR